MEWLGTVMWNDASIYAFVWSALHSPLGSELKVETLKYDNLVTYDKRMFQLVFFKLIKENR